MTTQDQLRTLVGTTAYDRSGDKVGKIGAVYYDDNTDEPRWLTVHTGLFGTNETFVPVQGAEFAGDRVTLAYDKAQVKDAPNISRGRPPVPAGGGEALPLLRHRLRRRPRRRRPGSGLR